MNSVELASSIAFDSIPRFGKWCSDLLSDYISGVDIDTIQPGYLGPTPLPGRLPPKGKRVWVERPEQLVQAARLLKKARVVAIDAEFTQVRPHVGSVAMSTVPRLALLQLAIHKCCFIVDALRLNDLSPLQRVVGDPEISVLVHGAGTDLRVMAERGLQVVHYYDLEAACRSIYGQHESSLAAMLQRAYAIRLDKSLQRTDWTRRPLPPAMIAYAARDAEVTLALYHWLNQHHHAILQLHENAPESPVVAAWIEPFLYGGDTPSSPEVAIARAKAHGLIANTAQVCADCRNALAALTHPRYRSRLLRLIANLPLPQLVPDIMQSLQAATSDERAAAVRALSRLGARSKKQAIRRMLQDPVQDVRKAALIALRNLGDAVEPSQHATSTRAADGTRSWAVGDAELPQFASVEDKWRRHLRSMIEP